MAGLMGWQPDDVRIPNALKLAAEAGVKIADFEGLLEALDADHAYAEKVAGKNPTFNGL